MHFVTMHLNRKAHPTAVRNVEATEEGFTGFVLKLRPIWIQNSVTVLHSCVSVQESVKKV